MRARAASRALRPVSPGPITISGFFSDPRGVAQSARLSAEALEREGLPVVRHDIGALLSGTMPPPPPGDGGLLLLHANPPEAAPLLRAWPTRTWAGRYRVGYWVWELEIPPATWRAPVPWVDEIWTPSHFSAGAMAKLGRPDKVRVMAHPVRAASAAPARARFGIADGEVAVLTAFDFRSTRARKNPDAAIAAYLAAQPQANAAARLVIKALAPDADPAGAAALADLAARRADVTVIDQTLSESEMAALVASADILLSMHRSEGFGLLPAQAMALGKAVVMTGWSGVTEFADEQCAALVPYRLVPVNDPTGLYSLEGARWAEPDVGAAAGLLRGLIERPQARHALAEPARRKITSVLGAAFSRASFSPQARAWIAGA